MRYAFIRDHEGQFPVELTCEVLEVSRSGYYAWMQRSLGVKEVRREELVAKIRQVHQESRANYGSPRIHRALEAQGVDCCENTVAKLMNGRRSVPRRSGDSGSGRPTAGTITRWPRTSWAASSTPIGRTGSGPDITYIPTAKGWLYLAVVLDLFSRKVVGWATADHMRAELTRDALEMALAHRRPEGEVLHHSDRGVQYASQAYQGLLREHEPKGGLL